MINLQETHNNPPSAMRGFIKTVLLIFTMDVTSGQISIQPIPQYPVINGSVTLSLSGINEILDSVTWYKGQDSFPWLFIVKYSPRSSTIFPGKQHNDRISVFNNGSLRIKDLQITDEGRYTAEIYREKSLEKVKGILTIYEFGNVCEDSTGHIYGLAFGSILGILLIIVISVYLYRKCLTKRRNGSTKNGEEKIHDYQNNMAAEPREDPSYMGLESNTEDIYTELKH
ncbi:cell adhesion molecule CEACAM10-like isoform X1 [Phyllobates terribilis]|uniref:cell adhesion molecule CEACAM10-like isoform X1 n=1 Tax=Phyllobates terribilis TaxID=111132 RepID=UPI003CCADEE9